MKHTSIPTLIAALALSFCAAALAQSSSTGAGGLPPKGDHPVRKDITKDEAMKRAGEGFDRADKNHDGVLNAEERKAAMDAHKERADRREARRASKS